MRPDNFARAFLVIIKESIGLIEAQTTAGYIWVGLFSAAFIIHLWLPLLALSIIILKVLNYFRIAVRWVQWFIERGNQHPLDAIGYMAGMIVFVLAGILQWIGRG
jgi:hypothetical protein